MLLDEYDLSVVQQRYQELRNEASAYRLAQAATASSAPSRGLLDRLRTLVQYTGLVARASSPAKAAA